MAGDLSRLSPGQRVEYYGAVCSSVGLNPLTKPFDYINLNGKLTLYAKKDCADQLRSINGVSVTNLVTDIDDGMIIVTANVTDRHGRSDSDVGVVTVGNLQGDKRANAIMKAVTKAKRRATLSLCGLGWLDETEIDTIPSAGHVKIDHSTGEVMGSVRPDPVVLPDFEIGQKVEYAGSNGPKVGFYLSYVGEGKSGGHIVLVDFDGAEYKVDSRKLTAVIDGEQSELPIEVEEVVEVEYD